MKFKLVHTQKHVLAESVTWDSRRGCLFWIDIQMASLFTIKPDGLHFRKWSFSDRICSMGLCCSGRLIIALAKQVILFDIEEQKSTLLCNIEEDIEYTRLNDGKVGPDGAFWVGSMDERANRESVGALYRVTADGDVQPMIEKIKVSNGLAWSLDTKTMFHADTGSSWIDRWDFNVDDGSISNRVRISHSISDVDGRPDGGACDVEGNYWSAGVSGALINCYSREGNLLSSIPVPVSSPTTLCFGGANLDTMYLTSMTYKQSEEKLVKYPFTGMLIACDSPVKGVPVTLFDDC